MTKFVKESNIDNLSATRGTIENGSVEQVVGSTIYVDEQPFIFTEQSGPLGTTTLTPAQIRGGRILHTAANNDVFTLPTGTVMDTALNTSITGSSFFLTIINTPINTVTLGAAVGFTVTGGQADPQGIGNRSSALFMICRLGTNSWTALRIGESN